MQLRRKSNSAGARRSKAARFADAIVEVTETGSSLAGQQSADRRRAALDEHAPLHQQRAGLCRSVETAEDGRPGFDAARARSGRRQGRSRNEVRKTDRGSGSGRPRRNIPKTSLNSPTVSTLTDPDWLRWKRSSTERSSATSCRNSIRPGRGGLWSIRSTRSLNNEAKYQFITLSELAPSFAVPRP